MNKKYQIYGMGNALVDLELKVDDKFLRKHQIEKGIMTLVDEQKQNEILNDQDGKNMGMQCGGSAANSIIAASQLGAKCFYSCKVAKDDLGQFYVDDLMENGVDSNLLAENLEEGITGKCLVMITEDAERTMNTYLGLTTKYSERELDSVALKESEYLYMEGYLVTGEDSREAMKTAKKLAEASGVKVALTFSDPSMVKYFRDGLIEVVGNGVDLLFCNEEEALLFTEADSFEKAVEELKKYASQFAITMGAKGALVFDGQQIIEVEPHVVEAVDTNGAGDMFAGAFMYGITQGMTFVQSGKLASLASSKVVGKYGPRLSEQELKSLKKEIY